MAAGLTRRPMVTPGAQSPLYALGVCVRAEHMDENDDHSGPEYVIRRDDISFEGFQSSKNKYGIVALAIGKWLSMGSHTGNRPEWAFEVCLSLYNKSQIATRPLIAKKQGHLGYDKDELVLEVMADLQFPNRLGQIQRGSNNEPSMKEIIRTAFRLVSKNPKLHVSENDISRIEQLWARDKNHRTYRATKRFVRDLKAGKIDVTQRDPDQPPETLSPKHARPRRRTNE